MFAAIFYCNLSSTRFCDRHVRTFHRSAAALKMALAILFYYVVGTLMVGFKLFLALFWKEPVTMLKPAELTGSKVSECAS